MEFTPGFFKEFFRSLIPTFMLIEDSYKELDPDDEGKGFYERFMTTFGEFIDDEIAPAVDNYLNVIDPTICDETFLIHISDVLGNPPDIFLDQVRYRNLLRYIVSVYKIKGTKRAYELFFHIMGYNIEITEVEPLTASSNYDNEGQYDTGGALDLYDQNICQPCSTYSISFSAVDVDSPLLDYNILQLLLLAIEFNEPINATLTGLTMVVEFEDELDIELIDEDFETIVEDINAYDTIHLYDEELDEEVETSFNYDITADWDGQGVSNEAEFILWLIGRNPSITDIEVTDFLLIGNSLKCNLTADSVSIDYTAMGMTEYNKGGIITNLVDLNFSANPMTVFDPVVALPEGLSLLTLRINSLTVFDPSIALPTTLSLIDLRGNPITSFDPSIALPDNLQSLDLSECTSLTSFDPSIALPDSLTEINFASSALTSFDPSIALPTGLSVLILGGNPISVFDPSITLPSNLIYLDLVNCNISIFDPSIALPTSLLVLNLGGNIMTYFLPTLSLPVTLGYLGLASNMINTIGWTISEPWASSMPIVGFGDIDLSANVNSAAGTTLESILLGKGWNVNT